MTIRIIVGFSGIVIWAIAMFAAIDVVWDHPTPWMLDTWGRPGYPMAVPTMVCFLFTGLALFLIGASNRLWRR